MNQRRNNRIGACIFIPLIKKLSAFKDKRIRAQSKSKENINTQFIISTLQGMKKMHQG